MHQLLEICSVHGILHQRIHKNTVFFEQTPASLQVKDLLTYVLEQCNHREMREIYLRANLESIFQATRYEVHEILVESALSRGVETVAVGIGTWSDSE